MRKTKKRYVFRPRHDELSVVVRFNIEDIRIAKQLMSKGGGFDYAPHGYAIPRGTLELLAYEGIEFFIVNILKKS